MRLNNVLCCIDWMVYIKQKYKKVQKTLEGGDDCSIIFLSYISGGKKMKKLLVMMLVVAMSVTMLAGCNTNTNGEATSQNTGAGTVSSSEEGISDGEVSENEVSEEMTLEEKIAAEMPAKLEVGEDEIIVPETVTAE